MTDVVKKTPKPKKVVNPGDPKPVRKRVKKQPPTREEILKEFENEINGLNADIQDCKNELVELEKDLVEVKNEYETFKATPETAQ